MGLPETVPFLGWRWDDLVFLALVGVALGSALLVVLSRDIIRSGLWLVLSFAGLAGFYVLLGSPLLAVTQVLVYIGAVAVLILFAIMITQSKSGPGELIFQRQWWAALLAAIVIVVLLVGAILTTAWPLAGSELIPQDAREIARRLFGEYLFAFEIVGVLLLAAVIGGLYLARRETRVGEPEGAPETLGDAERA